MNGSGCRQQNIGDVVFAKQAGFKSFTLARLGIGDGETQAVERFALLSTVTEYPDGHVIFDEGQMVAEDDEIAILDTESGRVVVVTDVPGVVRELYVEAGYPVTPGTVVALIDES